MNFVIHATEGKASCPMKVFSTTIFTSLLLALPAGHAIIPMGAGNIAILLISIILPSVPQVKGSSNSETSGKKPGNVF
jgi:hypothetical protein